MTGPVAERIAACLERIAYALEDINRRVQYPPGWPDATEKPHQCEYWNDCAAAHRDLTAARERIAEMERAADRIEETVKHMMNQLSKDPSIADIDSDPSGKRK